MGLASVGKSYQTKRNDTAPTAEDKADLEEIKKIIAETAAPFGDYINTVPKAALNSADPDNKREGWTSLASYYVTLLEENAWMQLAALQEKYGNLSNESLTLITSLDEIIERGIKTAFAHDRVLKEFFMSWSAQADRLPLVDGLESSWFGMPLYSYEDYLRMFDVAKHP